jgi:cAMP-dependent protein kinase regulator
MTPADHDRVREHKDRAVELAAQGKLAEAVEEYQEALRLAPGSVIARQRTAELLARLGKKAQAVEQYLCLVGKYASEGYLLKAIATCHLVLELDPLHAATQAILADLYARRDAPRAPVRIPSTMCAALSRREGERPSAPATFVDPETLARVPLFSDLLPGAFVSLVREVSRREVSAGDVVVEEGDVGDALFAIAHGLVRVERRSRGGDARVIAELGEGEFFGEMSLLSRCPRLATVTAARDCELLELRRDALERIGAEHPSVVDVLTRFYRERLLANVLRASPVFQKLPPERRAPLMELFRLEAHPPQKLLLAEGQPGSELFLLLRGECQVFHRVNGGREEHVVPMREGDVFGEIALLQGGVVTASVRTATPCVVLGLGREWVDDLLLANPGVREALYKLAARRLERTREIIAKDVLDERLV